MNLTALPALSDKDFWMDDAGREAAVIDAGETATLDSGDVLAAAQRPILVTRRAAPDRAGTAAIDPRRPIRPDPITSPPTTRQARP